MSASAQWQSMMRPPSAAQAAARGAKRKASPSTAPTARKKEQLYLDFGQKSFGQRLTCATCGMVYTKGEPKDEAAHKKHHERAVSGASMQEGPAEHVVERLADGSRVVMIDGQRASEPMLKRVRHALTLMEPELGEVALPASYRALLRISAQSRLMGATVIHPLQSACRAVPHAEGSAEALRHDGVPRQAACGISHVWVHPTARRDGVASSLLDAVCKHAGGTFELRKESLAFSQPTALGRRLAAAYVGTERFLVYDDGGAGEGQR